MAGRVYDHCALPDGGHNWTPIFAIPATVTFLSLLFFALFFRDKRKESPQDDPSKQPSEVVAKC